MPSARAPVRATYSHKRGRGAARKNISSSPVEDPVREDVTRSEMSRRVLKRAQRSQDSQTHPDNNSRRIHSAQERLGKRARRISSTQGLDIEPDPASLEDITQFDVGVASKFQTPYLSNDKIESPPVKSVTVEQLSPLPVARRILSRTSSRNLKENSRGFRNLASPFHSRPGSVVSSPKGKSQRNRLLHNAMSRTLSDDKEQDYPEHLLLAVDHRTKVSPDFFRLALRDRRPSVPNPSFMMQQMARQDWLVPPKALSRFPTDDIDPYSVGSSPELSMDSSVFFGGPPLAVSTPFRNRPAMSGPTGRIYAPLHGSCTPELVDGSIHGSPVAIGNKCDDVFMTDGTLAQSPDYGRSPASCSIISDSIPSPTSVNVVRDPADVNRLKLVTLPTYDLIFPHLQNRSGDDDKDSIFSPLCSPDYTIQLPPLHSSSEKCESILQGSNAEIGLPLTATPAWLPSDGYSDPVIATRPASPQEISSLPTQMLPGAAGQGLQDLFIELALDECQKGVSSDEEPSHDSGIGMKEVLVRSRSLDNPGEPLNRNKTEKRRTRDRRGTIRASDFVKTKDGSGSNDDVVSRSNGARPTTARRTRSGTIIGPPRILTSSLTKALVPKTSRPGRNKRQTAASKADDLPKVPDEESEDELLLKAHWRDDGCISVADGSTISRDSRLDTSVVDSDDDLLLKATQENRK